MLGSPIIGIYGTTSNPGFRAKGFVISSNTITTDYEDASRHVVYARGADDISMVGNYWRAAHSAGTAPVDVTGCQNVEVLGNGGDNGTA